MAETILIADDDEELVELLGEYLRQEGFDVRMAHDGQAALDAARAPGVDAMVLDIMMPGQSGLEVLKALRRDSALPVVMLTARGEDLDRILGLELGADDYLPKPCNPRELVARLRAVLRRAGGMMAEVLRADDVELRPSSRELRVDGQPVALTSTEFSLAQALLSRVGQVVDKRDLYLAALGREPVRFDRSIDMHMSNLRRKLGPLADGRERIQTVRGIGYQYVLAADGAG
ncbi:response regulator transcription factor [Marinihelvus fidelis]|uniref:response regulator transcription factor n=1 Tax=Marinihelvus fidelis TaxID=2613842 RepID=UPI001CD34277|nr:response regulator transcription factor [Marinihelvus fidelis]